MIRRLALLLLVGPAAAQESVSIGVPSAYLGTTYVLLRETEEPGAVAELFFYNVDVNDPTDEGSYTVEWNGITVSVLFHHNVAVAGQDSIDIFPPPGLVAIPPTLTLLEGYGDIVYFYPEGMS